MIERWEEREEGVKAKKCWKREKENKNNVPHNRREKEWAKEKKKCEKWLNRT